MGQTVIEINGNRYDASTGSIVPAPQAAPRNIDGINATPTHNLAPQSRPHPVHVKTPRFMNDVTVQKRHGQQKSKTLMRHVVKKPGVTSQHLVQPTSTHQLHNASYAASSQHHVRLEKALSTPTHPTVSRFTHHSSQKLQPTLQHIPVVEPAIQQATHAQPQQSIPYRQPDSNSFVDSQLSKVALDEPKAQKKASLGSKLKRGFSKRKFVSVAAGFASFALVAGFLVYQNLPTLSLAIATKNAGISMSVPKGIPSNFAMSNTIDYAPGLITLNFTSKTDDRTFTITQQKITEGTQESLEKAIAISARGEYQTYQRNGLKLFMVDAGKADWIDGDMRYSVSGDSGLSSEQLATIATSL